jgi:hypothetical protein
MLDAVVVVVVVAAAANHRITDCKYFWNLNPFWLLWLFFPNNEFRMTDAELSIGHSEFSLRSSEFSLQSSEFSPTQRSASRAPRNSLYTSEHVPRIKNFFTILGIVDFSTSSCDVLVHTSYIAKLAIHVGHV